MEEVTVRIADGSVMTTLRKIPPGTEWSEAQAYAVFEELDALYNGDDPWPEASLEAPCTEDGGHFVDMEAPC